MEPKTWRDVEEAALHCPVLHQAVTLVQRGDLTEMQALIIAALRLSRMRQEWMDREVERLMNQPAK
jgi:hypothetical protein